MSEFTAGSLALKKSMQKVEQHSTVTSVQEINDNWIVFITNDTSVSDIVPESVFEISKEFPILYFFNFEDHCWGYYIILQGKIVANISFSYEEENTAVVRLAEERHPDEDIMELLYIEPNAKELYNKLLFEVKDNPEYLRKIEEQLENKNVEFFKLFNIPDEVITKLEYILSAEYWNNLKNKHDLVEEFKQLLEINEMRWIRSDRV
ncbi:hypothetical protein VQL36_09510 [Chengkuizengella sp. SCS-71B]|uniref:hypothetical protein n=1 Tax=Chengkuizengella sp. SCS-71B TaxID=3115290 RepID=UPI0032C226A7